MKEHTALPHYSITYCCSSDIKSSEGNTITKVTYNKPNMYSITVTAFCHQPSQSKELLFPFVAVHGEECHPKKGTGRNQGNRHTHWIRVRRRPHGVSFTFEHPQMQNLKANCSLGNRQWSWLTCPNHRTGTNQPSTRAFNSLGTLVSPFDDFLCNFL